MGGRKTPTIRPSWKGPYVFTPDLAVLPASEYDPAKWHILVCGEVA